MRNSIPIFVIAISAFAMMAAPALVEAAPPLRLAQADNKQQDGAERQIQVEPQEPSAEAKPEEKADTKAEESKEETTTPEAAEAEQEPAKDEAAKPETKDEPDKDEAATEITEEPAQEEAAAEAPAPEEEVALAVDKLSRDQIILVLQQELNRVGCYQATLDGKWGPQSHRALEAFGHFAKLDKADFAPSADWVRLVQEQAEEVCPPSYAYTPRHEPSYGPREPRRSNGGYSRRGYVGYGRRNYDGYGPRGYGPGGGYGGGYRGPFVGGY